ncbi:hypothetical protein NFI96_012077 [Prochilodus magdalenae]|nr:hypothetical protein NFI96_012077 [Prochilodus magdalenae]
MMTEGSHPMKFVLRVQGNPLYSHMNFLDRLKERLQLSEVYSVDQSSVIIAFVAIESRVGTDIAAALQEIPSTQPVVLVVLHHTFDPNFVAPDSRYCTADNGRDEVFTVDCLFHEDKGLLRCERNDWALKVVTDYLLSKGAPARSSLLPRKWPTTKWTVLWGLLVALVVLAVVVPLLYLFVFKKQK